MYTFSKVLRSKPTELLYHYTDAKGLIGILESRQIWASNIRHLNDSSEFVQSNRMLKAEITRRLRDEPLGLHPDWSSLLSEIEAEGDEWYYRT